MPFFLQNNWNLSCSNRDAIVASWCAPTMDAPGCQVVKVNQCAAVCGSSSIALGDPEIESATSPQFGAIVPWGPNRGWALHSQFPRANNQSLGQRFGFYAAGTTETFGQILTARFAPSRAYTFRSWAQGGGDDTGRLPYQIGYAAVDGDRNSFVPLATNVIRVGVSWAQTAGVNYTSPASGVPVGRQIIVRFGSGANGGQGDVWFDNMSLTVQ